MPFTLSHPVGALPFKWINKNWFSTTGLVVGSMAPDYEYFLQQGAGSSLGESSWGLLLFDFPLAILGALIFHLLIKRPLIRHLPAPFDRRWSGYWHQPFLAYLGRHWAIFLLSLLIGLASHMLLDWLTTPDAALFAGTSLKEPVQLGPFYQSPVVLAEYLFSALALIALLVVLLRLKHPAADYVPAPKGTKWMYWGLFFLVAAAIMVWEWLQTEAFEGFIKILITVIWALMCGLVVASLVMRFSKRFTQN